MPTQIPTPATIPTSDRTRFWIAVCNAVGGLGKLGAAVLNHGSTVRRVLHDLLHLFL